MAQPRPVKNNAPKEPAQPPAEVITKDESPIVKPAITPFQRMKRANALTGVLSNKDFVQVVQRMDEGAFLMEIFAKAIEAEMENMFRGEVKESSPQHVGDLVKSIDVAYAKMQAMASSPLQQVLERLLVNIGGSLQPEPHQETPFVHTVSSNRLRGEGIVGY